MIHLVAFLGNYGNKYSATRHNAAWIFADALPFAHRLDWQAKFKGLYCSVGMAQLVDWISRDALCKTESDAVPVAAERAPARAEHASSKIFFLKPQTYMNASGESIIELVNFYKLKAEEVLVVHDELELPVGTISFKWSGGLGGHNGLRSTKAVLNTADFWRLRFGIGRPNDDDVAAYVLSPFTSDERITLEQTFPNAAELLARALLAQEPSALLKTWGKKKIG
ncbi:MAG: aminoacyl-tRNA hydrolase [Treponema sp.]|nr:aminoacyl-tRNA hydrolase [Treponema sp.]